MSEVPLPMEPTTE